MAVGIRCYGKVQGVFFRATTRDKAQELGIRGWVQNERDGTVLIHAEGPENQLESFVSWTRQGPDAALVTDVKIWQAPDEDFQQFEIRQ